ncbi:MoaD/ThiS family protein [Aquabacter spiritensis]|uniref:Molybdopterin synthase subunit MoaD n=1 Tax=Aquabacter spiritensis TaxID=933073 RepID=A0A4R3M450_9HYPH|nr:MoaD/ThiS family protein [Aquabacter spiritensis]TCT08051.1 molybdopterin synthase subunit MoaD [Aquabacter spiritensis]
MPVHVRLPAHLVALFPGAPRRLDIEAASVGEMMAALDALWPGMRDRLCDSTPAIRRHINVFVGGRRANLATPLHDGTDVHVLTAISGG